MKTPLTPITEDQIKQLAGPAVFKRGYVYFEENRATLESESKTSLNFIVSGSEEYEVKIHHTARQFEAICDCPAAQGFDFCKHCVAASLVYLQKLAQTETLKKSSGIELLAAYLHSLPKEQLIASLTDHIQRNPITLQNWMLKAENAAEKLDAKALKKHITSAIPYNRHLFRHPQVRSYFGKVESLVETIELHAHEIDPDEMIKLADYAYKRIARALETVDDSGGFRFDSMEMLARLHINAMAQSDQSPAKKAEMLCQIYVSDVGDFYPAIPDAYAEALDQQVLAHFYQRLHQLWQALPEMQPGSDNDRQFDRKLDYLHILAPLLTKARREGDSLAEIRYLEKSATSVRDMIEVSRLHTERSEINDAYRWLDEARQLSGQSGFREDHQSIINQQVRLLVAEARHDDAIELLWQRFAEKSTLNNYQSLVKLAREINNKTDWYKKVIGLFAQRQDAAVDAVIWEQLARIHLEEHSPERALSLATDHKLSVDLLRQILTANSGRLEAALPLLQRIAEFYISQGSTKNYQQAVDAITDFDSRLGKKDRKQLYTLVNQLRDKHKIKRSLVSLLDGAFNTG